MRQWAGHHLCLAKELLYRSPPTVFFSSLLVVIDTSAIVAILFDEDDARRFADAIDHAPVRLMSALTRVELSIVIESRKGDAGRDRLERFLALIGPEIVAVTAEHAALAIGGIPVVRQRPAPCSVEHR